MTDFVFGLPQAPSNYAKYADVPDVRLRHLLVLLDNPHVPEEDKDAMCRELQEKNKATNDA